ncbi:MAG: hypothetical protein AB8H80_00575 [Planctomycetota bacterium]
MPNPQAAPGPKPHKMMLLTWLGIYPTITLTLWLLLPTLMQYCSLPVITLIVTAIVIPLMTYVVMPTLMRRFGQWAHR